jgi:DNA-binding transcriptional ArsR family regulator
VSTETLVFRALADPTRRQILDRLREHGALRVGDIAAGFQNMSRIAVSKHLRILSQAKLVRVIPSQDRREHLYALDAQGLQGVATWLHPYEVYWRAKLEDLKRIVEMPNENEDT